MLYAFISDIHSNLEALSAVLTKCADIGADNIVCLGDIVGYNANPNECIELIRKNNIRSVMGNHDERAAGLCEPDTFNAEAQAAIYWTREAMSREHRAYLKSLPQQVDEKNGISAVHGTLRSHDEYLFSAEDAPFELKLVQKSAIKILFFGHTHSPALYGTKTVPGASVYLQQETILDPSGIYLVNPGSVGQPRDGDPRAAFCTFDSESGVLKFHRVEYDIKKASQKVLAAGLPEYLGKRLFTGR
ncbi:MAG: metallophosphatase family protein [Deltaproteobacteria bacterium]|nr:metallophosphatase family protein [Deltaproteobacteria bacterium]